MALREKSAQHRQKSVNTTFEASSINSSTVEEKLFGHAGEDEDGDDGPVVFICGKCKLPVGDSLSWDGSEDGQNQIRLKRESGFSGLSWGLTSTVHCIMSVCGVLVVGVTDNVLVGEDTRLYEASKKSLCLITDLFCQGCSSVLGMIYASTPKNLDHKRFAFCLNVADIDSYILGSANQMLAAEGPKEQPVTLEYRGIVEQQLTEMKMLVMSMAQRLEEIEAGL
uniref:Protein Mis18-alpha n=1 Tax=Lates calcarifer TaxID=8187 RepID=A0A4W6FWU4_LATCA